MISQFALNLKLPVDWIAEQDGPVACATLHLLLGKLYYAHGEFKRAREQLEQILQDAEQIGDGRILALTYGTLGDVHYREGRYAEAMTAYQQAVESHLSDPIAGRGDTSVESLTDSLAPFKRLIELDSQNVWGLYALGTALVRDGQRDEAIAEFERCIAVDPRFLPARIQLAALYQERRNYPASISAYRAAISACELDDELLADLYLGLGDVYRAQGNYELSIASYQQAIRAVRSAQDLTAGRDQQFDEGAFSLD